MEFYFHLNHTLMLQYGKILLTSLPKSIFTELKSMIHIQWTIMHYIFGITYEVPIIMPYLSVENGQTEKDTYHIFFFFGIDATNRSFTFTCKASICRTDTWFENLPFTYYQMFVKGILNFFFWGFRSAFGELFSVISKILQPIFTFV